MKKQNCQIATVVMVTLSLVVTASVAREMCLTTQRRCVRRVGCGTALRNYLVSCADVVNSDDYDFELPADSKWLGSGRQGGGGGGNGPRGRGRGGGEGGGGKSAAGAVAGWGGTAAVGTCTPGCRRALISLLSTEDAEGEQFLTCDCKGEAFCVEQRQRLEVCGQDVLQSLRAALDDTTPIDCTLAEMICAADTSCQAALDYYRDHCRKLFAGERCTQRCNNSLAILYRQEKGRKLHTCLCDGSELYNCPALREYTNKLCFPHLTVHHRTFQYFTTTTSSPTRHRPRPHGGTVVLQDFDVPLPQWPEDYEDSLADSHVGDQLDDHVVSSLDSLESPIACVSSRASFKLASSCLSYLLIVCSVSLSVLM